MKSRVKYSYVLRVEETSRGLVITVQDLKTGERLEFDSWLALARHLQIYTAKVSP